jgi:hypothetical protein
VKTRRGQQAQSNFLSFQAHGFGQKHDCYLDLESGPAVVAPRNVIAFGFVELAHAGGLNATAAVPAPPEWLRVVSTLRRPREPAICSAKTALVAQTV